MLRWLLIGILLAGLGTSFRNGWIEVHWDRVHKSLGLPGSDWNERILDTPQEAAEPAPRR